MRRRARPAAGCRDRQTRRARRLRASARASRSRGCSTRYRRPRPRVPRNQRMIARMRHVEVERRAMRAVQRRPTRCIDDDRHRPRHDAEGRAEHVAQRGARRGAAHRILMPHEACGPRALAVAQCRIRGRRSGTRQSKSTRAIRTPARPRRPARRALHARRAGLSDGETESGGTSIDVRRLCGRKRPMLIDQAIWRTVAARRRRCRAPRVLPACAKHEAALSPVRGTPGTPLPGHARAMPDESHARSPAHRLAARRVAASRARAATVFR